MCSKKSIPFGPNKKQSNLNQPTHPPTVFLSCLPSSSFPSTYTTIHPPTHPPTHLHTRHHQAQPRREAHPTPSIPYQHKGRQRRRQPTHPPTPSPSSSPSSPSAAAAAAHHLMLPKLPHIHAPNTHPFSFP